MYEVDVIDDPATAVVHMIEVQSESGSHALLPKPDGIRLGDKHRPKDFAQRSQPAPIWIPSKLHPMWFAQKTCMVVIGGRSNVGGVQV